MSAQGKPPPSVADVGHLETLIARARELLGDSFEPLQCSYRRLVEANASTAHLHPLMALVHGVDRSISGLRAEPPIVDAFSVVELDQALGLFARWRHDLLWPSLVRSLKSPDDFDHAVATLTAASFLADFHGNDVRLADPADSPGRYPDLRVSAPTSGPQPSEPVMTEVKAPRALRRPLQPLDLVAARKFVGTRLSRAGTSSEGQLRGGSCSLLVVGGFHLRKSDLYYLARAAEHVLAQPYPRPRLFGIFFVAIGIIGENLVVGPGRITTAVPGGFLHATIAAQEVGNPRYDGKAMLSRRVLPTHDQATFELREIEPS